MGNSLITYVIALYIRLSAEDSKVGSSSIENQKRRFTNTLTRWRALKI